MKLESRPSAENIFSLKFFLDQRDLFIHFWNIFINKKTWMKYVCTGIRMNNTIQKDLMILTIAIFNVKTKKVCNWQFLWTYHNREMSN